MSGLNFAISSKFGRAIHHSASATGSALRQIFVPLDTYLWHFVYSNTDFCRIIANLPSSAHLPRTGYAVHRYGCKNTYRSIKVLRLEVQGIRAVIA